MDYDPQLPRLRTWEKPPELETRSRWERWNRRVRRGEKPTAILVYEVTRKKFVGDGVPPQTVTLLREIGLFAVDQTKKFRPTPKTRAIRALANIFLRYSSSHFYLWHTEGEWKSCNGCLSFERFREHLDQKAIYGVRGNGRWTRYGGIDLDLHNGDKDIFLEQLDVLLEEFHGREGWHFQVADIDAKGVHLLQALAERLDYELYRSGLRARLQALDLKYPALTQRAKNAGMKSLGNLEIFPNVGNGLRLVFCRGRTMLLDTPLPQILVKGKYAVDVERYIAWVDNPVAYMPRKDVREYIVTRLVTRQVGAGPVASNIAEPSFITPKQPIRDSSAVNTPVRNNVTGKYARLIIDFWSGNSTPPKSLNQNILLLANIAPFYFATREEAVTAIENMIDGLEDINFSARLSSGDSAEVSRVVRNAVKKAFASSSSNQKLIATFDAWSQKGFNPFDRSTWSVTAGRMKLGANFDWTQADQPVLDEMQGILKTNATRTAAFTKELMRIVAGHDGEIAITFVECLLKNHGIKRGSNRDRKASKVMKLLLRLNWIVMLEECHWHPRQADKSHSPGLARRYGIGHGFPHGTVSGDSSNHEEKRDMYPLLPHHVVQHILPSDEFKELAQEQARLRVNLSDVEPLSDDDRRALDEFFRSPQKS